MAAPYYKYRLQKYYTAVLRDLEPRKLVNILYQEEVFDDDDMEEVKCERTRKKQAEVLLQKVKLLSDDEVAIVVDSLQQTQRHLYELLQTPVQGEERNSSQVRAGLGLSGLYTAFLSLIIWKSINALRHQQPI